MGSGDHRTTNELDSGVPGTVRQDEPPVAAAEGVGGGKTLADSEREQTREMGYANDGELARLQHDAPRQPAGGTYSSLGPNDESGQRSFAAEEAGANIRAYERDRNPAMSASQPLRDPDSIEDTPEPKSGGSMLAEEEPEKPTRFDHAIDEANKSEPGDQ